MTYTIFELASRLKTSSMNKVDILGSHWRQYRPESRCIGKSLVEEVRMKYAEEERY
jgi:hypothetical protein